MKNKSNLVLACFLSGLATPVSAAEGNGASFSYQGYLTRSNSPVSGSVKMGFRLYDGNQPGAKLLAETTQLVNADEGIFNANLNFGDTIAGKDPRWLELLLLHPGDVQEVLQPRQPMAPAPTALFAGLADGLRPGTLLPSNSVPMSAIDTSGAVTDGIITFDGISPIWRANGFWNLNGNTGTSPGRNFLGTRDNAALELRANNARALRLEPGAVPNIIAGHGDNFVPEGIVGATIGGGGGVFLPYELNNDVNANYGTVAGGQANHAYGEAATIGGGRYNVTGDTNTTIAGGANNSASKPFATVGGGFRNEANGYASVVAGGGGEEQFDSEIGRKAYPNRALNVWSTVSGGAANTASGQGSVVSGGRDNTAAGDHSVVPGGRRNQANGLSSFAGGQNAHAEHTGSFVWSDTGTVSDFASTRANEFSVRATGGVRLVSGVNFAGSPAAGVQLAPGSGAWSSLSDRQSKTNVAHIDRQEILARLAQIPISTWNYKSQDAAVRHIGPMAQDFAAAFGVGENDRTISTVDADGVALAAIQGLHELMTAKDAELVDLRQRLAAVERALLHSNR